MKIIEIPGIGDICNIDISEVRDKLSEESKKHKVIADSMKQIGSCLRCIEIHTKKIHDALGTNVLDEREGGDCNAGKTEM